MNIFFNNNENRPRAGWRLLAQFILMVVFAGLGVVIFQFLFPGSRLLISTFAQFVGIIASVWVAAKYLDKRSVFDFGIHFDRRWFLEFLWGSLFAIISVLTIFLIEYIAGWIEVSGYLRVQDPSTSFLASFLSSLLAMLMVGFHEELFSRGYQILNLTEGLHTYLGKAGAILTAVLLSSSLFGFMHFFNPNASVLSTFNIILAGCVLALPYILSGRLALSMGLHFCWNFTMGGIVGLPVSGQHFAASILNVHQSGPELWTGGHFGPEAGITGLIGMAIMAGGSYVYLKKKEHVTGISDKFFEFDS